MFRLVERPTLMPAKTLTGSTVGPVVDTEVILHGGGRPYLSEIEVGECAKFFPKVVERLATDLGWISPDHAQDMQAIIGDLKERIAFLEEEQPKVVSLDDALKLAKVAA